VRQALRISGLARSTGVTSKTLRYWERVGLLPKAARTHTGYRIFGADENHYIDFILKAKKRWHDLVGDETGDRIRSPRQEPMPGATPYCPDEILTAPQPQKSGASRRATSSGNDRLTGQ
jgi:DNA-binding transcriptional MerR regulator